MKNILREIYNRVVVHWIMTLKGVVYAIILTMYWMGKINTQEWITATGSIMAINALFSKDANKVETKPEVKQNYK
jgi:hypothetical protein